MDKIELLSKWIEESDNIVFLGGAGVSTESGIPDFRGVDGLYNQQWDFPPETILSHSFFEKNPEEFYRFYRAKMVVEDAEPNAAHMVLARLEREGKLKAVITQNIDSLHQKAGSKNVLELHGSTDRAYCKSCGKKYPGEYIVHEEGIPRCDCGGIVRPDVVLYEESLDSAILQGTMRHIALADMLIVGGTSLAVYPAAGMVDFYTGDKLVLINMQSTSYDSKANLVINEKIGEVMKQV